MGVAAQSCTDCANAGVAPLYAPGPSATDLSMPFSEKFDVGELGWSGKGYRDTVSVGGLETSVQFAAITAQTQYFFPGACDTPSGQVDAPYQGILGFGPASLLLAGSTSYIAQALQTHAIGKFFSLSYCHVGGTLWLGGYDPSTVSGPMQFVPMDLKEGYSVGWLSVAFGAKGAPIQFPSKTLGLVDSGGPGMILPDAQFAIVADALNKDEALQSVLGPSFMQTEQAKPQNCVDLEKTPAEMDALLPAMTMKLGDNTTTVDVQLPATLSYLTYYYGDGKTVTYCQALTNGGTAYGPLFYIGQSIFFNHVIVHDLAGSRMGIAVSKAQCPF
jgi:hypothetical protein